MLHETSADITPGNSSDHAEAARRRHAVVGSQDRAPLQPEIPHAASPDIMPGNSTDHAVAARRRHAGAGLLGGAPDYVEADAAAVRELTMMEEQIVIAMNELSLYMSRIANGGRVSDYMEF